MRENRVTTLICFVCALISGGDTVYRYTQTSKLVVSPLAFWFFCILVMCIIVTLLRRNVRLKYSIMKYIKYLTCEKDSFWVRKKECIYTYKTRTEMAYIKRHTLVSCIKNFTSFRDKFKWSKNQELEEIQISCTTQHRAIRLSKDENWHIYTVDFDAVCQYCEKQIDVLISNLQDLNKEAQPFLSSNILNRTEHLRLEVRFESIDLKPINIRYGIFNNYAVDYPYYEEVYGDKSKTLKYDAQKNIISIDENKPIYGYRYAIKWDFSD